MSEQKDEKEKGTKTRRNRPDAPLYMPPAVRNSHSLVSKSVHKENEENLMKTFINKYADGSIPKTGHSNSTNKTKTKKIISKSNMAVSNEVLSNNICTNHFELKEDTMCNDNLNNAYILKKIDEIQEFKIRDISRLESCIEQTDNIRHVEKERSMNKYGNTIERHDTNVQNKENNSSNLEKLVKSSLECKKLPQNDVDNLSAITNSLRDIFYDREPVNFSRKDNQTGELLVKNSEGYKFENNINAKDNNIIKQSTNTYIEVSKASEDSTNMSSTNIKTTNNKDHFSDVIKCDINLGVGNLLSKKKDNFFSANEKWDDKSRDQDVEEFLRASEGLNRCNKRIVKTFNVSDKLIIDKPTEQECDKVDSWEDLFDENGSLDTSLLTEVSKNDDNMTVTKPKEDYRENKIKHVEENSLKHIVEIYGFPSEFQTRDLLTILEHYKADTYHIKWVDDNHALGVFASESIALDVLQIQHPLIKLRPMCEASKQSITKAKKNPNAMMPVMARPQTCPHAARRMVTGALGLKLRSSKEDREKEKQILKEAREKKRLAVKQQDDAWEGKVSSK